MAGTRVEKVYTNTGDRRTYTVSAWVKRSKLGATQDVISAYRSTDGLQTDVMRFPSDDTFQFYMHSTNSAGNCELKTNRKFRDTNAWYHIVTRVDTTQSTNTNRVRIYINGVQETSFATENYMNQNGEGVWGIGASHTTHTIGAVGTANYFDGYVTHVHYADGQSLAPTVFGSTDSVTGEWSINTDPSFTLGTNGFTILKDGNTVTDQSTNSNDFSVASGTLTKSEDNPSNIFCTLNPLMNRITGYASGNATSLDMQNGNTFGNKVTHGAYFGTIGVSSGKFYWEVKVEDTNQLIGIVAMRPTGGVTYLYDDATINGYYPYGNNVYTNGSSASGGPYDNTSNKIYSFALDAGNNKLWVGRDGSFTGDPANGTGATWSSLPTGHDWTPLMHSMSTSQNNYAYFNFGNGYFGTTAISSEGTNASGIGKFEYNVPNGFTALSTKGLNE